MLDGGGEFSEVNGFGEILIHPGIEAKLPVLFHGMGGKSDDWNEEASGTLEGANGARRRPDQRFHRPGSLWVAASLTGASPGTDDAVDKAPGLDCWADRGWISGPTAD